MITCNIMENAGFANQLFIIAAAYGHAKKIGTFWAITENSFSRFEPYTPYLKSVFSKAKLNLTKYQEKGFHYTPIKGNNIELINSYFQSFKYWEHCQDEIKQLFEPTKKLKNQLPDFGDNSCAIHVRRKDYLHLSHYHYNLQSDYYEEAMKRMGDKRFVVFSDDIKWCKEQELFKNCEFYEGGDGNRTWEDLKDFFAMSSCKNQIIANSTFSLWASYLNSNPNKIIIAPGKWFAEKKEHKDTKDLYTPEMIII